MVLGKLPVPGRPTFWITVRQGPTAPAVGAGVCVFFFFFFFFFRHFYSHLSFLSSLSFSLWETARYRLKYCLKGPLNPKPTNQLIKCVRKFNKLIESFFSSKGDLLNT